MDSTIDSTVHSMSLNSLEHCIFDSNLVPPGHKPQSIRMSHRGRRDGVVTLDFKHMTTDLIDEFG